MAELVFFRRAEELMRVQLDGRRMVVGRAPTSDIVVPDPAVSRQQFAVERRGGQWLLCDLSGKGTDVAGDRVDKESALPDGADIGLAQWRAVFRLESGSGLPDLTTQATDQGSTAVQPRERDNLGDTAVRLHVVSHGTERIVPILSDFLGRTSCL